MVDFCIFTGFESVGLMIELDHSWIELDHSWLAYKDTKH